MKAADVLPGPPVEVGRPRTARQDASRLLGDGVDVETVRQILGHSEASTTLLYAQSSDARMKSAADKLRW